MDRTRVFYSKRTATGFEIWTTGVDGGDEHPGLGPVRSPAGWVPDQNGIYFIDPTGRIFYHRFATGNTTLIVTQPKPGLTLSPDGRWLVYEQMDRFGAGLAEL